MSDSYLYILIVIPKYMSDEKECHECYRKMPKEIIGDTCPVCETAIQQDAIRNEPYGGDDFMNYCMSGDCW